MMKHRFFQVDPVIVNTMNNRQILDYVLNHEAILYEFSVHDKVVRRNINSSCDVKKWLYIDRRKTRFFNDFSDYREDDALRINYHGITVIKTKALSKVINSSTSIHLFDMYTIMRLKRFFTETYTRNLWIIHLGI